MTNKLRQTPAITKQIDSEMQSMLSQYASNRKPVSVKDYDWDDIRPHTITTDLKEAIGFVTLVESNPTAPAQKLLDAADRSDAPWLRRFIDQTWLPEESMHAAPYREYLIRSGGYDQHYIDSEIDQVRNRGFIHGEGYSELQATTYGWLQELITWRFYDSMRTHIISKSTEDHPHDTVLAKILGDIAKQENFHRHVYLTGAKTILKHSPHRKDEVVSAVAEFLMPGHHMAPNWQPKAPTWAMKFNFSVKNLIKDIVRDLHNLTGFYGVGQATIQYGYKNVSKWYLRPVVKALAPMSRSFKSPINYLGGKLITKAFGVNY